MSKSSLTQHCTLSSKTPGGKLVYLYPKKPAKVPGCGNCHRKLRGIIALRPLKLMSVSKRHKTVTRAYGGHLCGQCLRERLSCVLSTVAHYFLCRIIRAFLIEEQKIVVHAMKAKAGQK